MAEAREAGESRIWGGIHFRSDVVAGETLGLDVANAVLAHATSDVMTAAFEVYDPALHE
jgi:hypothetical protein